MELFIFLLKFQLLRNEFIRQNTGSYKTGDERF
jgi:hypothetical protein